MPGMTQAAASRLSLLMRVAMRFRLKVERSIMWAFWSKESKNTIGGA
jgi:hypothetical protein